MDARGQIVEAGSRTDNPVRTILYLPAQVSTTPLKGFVMSAHVEPVPPRSMVLVTVSARAREARHESHTKSKGIQKTTLWLRIFLSTMKSVGYAGTWGPGANAMNNIHVKDCAMGLLLILEAALEGRADEGPEGLCKRKLVVVAYVY